MNDSEIGVVAIGRNEGQRLISCLRSIRSATDAIVYVDSGSTDGSAAAAKSLGANVVKLDMSSPFTAARARNAGFAALMERSPALHFVQFIDGDCIMVDGWLDIAVAFLRQHDGIAAVCGRRREREPTASIYNLLCDLEWDTPIGEAIACGGDVLIRADAFQSVRGFRSQLIAGEEPELCVRLRERGWRIWRLDADMTRHDAAMKRFSQWWVRTVRGGYGMTEVYWLHRNSRFAIWKRETMRAAFWGGVLPAVIGVATFIHPFALIGFIAYPLQVCRIAAVRMRSSFRPWTYALFVTFAKAAEFQGVLLFCWRRLLQRGPAELIEYK